MYSITTYISYLAPPAPVRRAGGHPSPAKVKQPARGQAGRATAQATLNLATGVDVIPGRKPYAQDKSQVGALLQQDAPDTRQVRAPERDPCARPGPTQTILGGQN